MVLPAKAHIRAVNYRQLLNMKDVHARQLMGSIQNCMDSNGGRLHGYFAAIIKLELLNEVMADGDTETNAIFGPVEERPSDDNNNNNERNMKQDNNKSNKEYNQHGNRKTEMRNRHENNQSNQNYERNNQNEEHHHNAHARNSQHLHQHYNSGDAPQYHIGNSDTRIRQDGAAEESATAREREESGGIRERFQREDTHWDGGHKCDCHIVVDCLHNSDCSKNQFCDKTPCGWRCKNKR